MPEAKEEAGFATKNQSPSHQQVHPVYRPDIDGLRAIAVLLVVIFHAFPTALPGGFVGVDLFFVISGYLITGILARSLAAGTYSIADFYSRRIRRIFPALLTVLGATYLACWLGLNPEEFKRFSTELLGGVAFVSNFVLWQQSGYFDVAAETKPLLHLWSLAIEEQFYLVWPVVLYILWRSGRRYAIATLVLLASSFAVSLYLVNSDLTAAFYAPWSRFWELLVGAVVAFWTPAQGEERRGNRHKHLFSITGLCLIGSAVMLLNRDSSFPGAWAVLPTVGAALIISAGPGAFLNRWFLSARPMVAIGLISYPLYLWHWPALVVGKWFESESTFVTVRLSAMSASIIAAWLTYRFIEKPVRAGRIRLSAVPALSAAMVAVGGIGIATYATNGFPVRLPAEVRDLASPVQWRWAEYVRSGTCFIQEVTASTRPENCIEERRPLVVLWGDSFAGALYPGFKALQQEKDFGIAQLTQSACPPLLDVDFKYRKNCGAINATIVETIESLQPDVIVMHSAWSHPDYWLEEPEILRKLDATLKAVRKASPGSRVVVIGPAPQWTDTLAKKMQEYYEKTEGHPFPPEYMTYGLNPRMEGLDQHMDAHIGNKGFQYVSMYRLLCNDSGCLTRVGSMPEDLTAMDFGHLSKAGAEYVARQAEGEIFGSSLLSNVPALRQR